LGRAYPRLFSAGIAWITLALLLASPAGAASIKLTCIGNSITDPSPYYSGYPAMLQTLLGERVLVQNAGRTTTTLLKRGDVPYWACDKFPLIFTFQPDIVTIKLGTNDVKPQNWQNSADFVADLNALIDTLEAIPSHPRVFLVLPTPAFPNIYGVNGDVLETALIPKIQQVAAARGLPIIDVHFPLLSSGNLFPDGVHPNLNGADSIAAIFHRTLRATPAPLLVPNHLEFEVSAGQAVAAKAVSLLTLATTGLEPVRVAGPPLGCRCG
jgi:lysophospholipase L1-like esterase